MRNSRHPRVGDMIVRKFEPTDVYINIDHVQTKDFIGLVRDIQLDRFGHQRSVFIEWTTEPPPDYSHKHGYAGVNIHNIRSEFDVIRDGVYIQ